MLIMIFLLAWPVSQVITLTPEMGFVGLIPLVGGMAVLAAAEGKKEPKWLSATAAFELVGGVILLLSVAGMPLWMIAIYLPAALGELLACTEWLRAKDPVSPVQEANWDGIDHTKEVLARALQESQKNG